MGKNKDKEKNKKPDNFDICHAANMRIQDQPFLRNIITGYYPYRDKNIKKSIVLADKDDIDVQVCLKGESFTESEWHYCIIHQKLHSLLGKFNPKNIKACMPKVIQNGVMATDIEIYKIACNMYNTQFIEDMKWAKCPFPPMPINVKGLDVSQIYERLMEMEDKNKIYEYAEKVSYFIRIGDISDDGEYDSFEEEWFAEKIVSTVRETVYEAGGMDGDYDYRMSRSDEAKEWFIAHYPLLGALASGFKICEDINVCHRLEISVAAVNVEEGIIYFNPAFRCSDKELRFIMAHEFLHAGLQHHSRCKGRNHYLWNVACDYVINDWLTQMQVGVRPAEVLYDEAYQGMSAEEIYDELIKDIKKALKLMTFRGYGKGDIFGRNSDVMPEGVSLDDFFRDALSQGLDYHRVNGRGYLPAGLVEEIRSLSMPPIKWDVKLAKWFEIYFPMVEKYRSYARPSRRQGSTPDIPRPRYVDRDSLEDSRTFGVVIDTSGSMSVQDIGKALGSICSFAAAREVPFVRVVFCDAAAVDAGYLSVEDLAGRVEVTGRGGTRLQPGIDLLENAKDFPKDGPILIITDGEIENHLDISHPHGFLLSGKGRLPFKAKGKFFRMS